ncbi:MAG: hypothetical protein ACT6R2_09830 [Blastomonas fulva]|uniref:hypothetical protein n=1 Tax=Blastomonas fulva TaxID=1550728 RepID=UPI00403328D6
MDGVIVEANPQDTLGFYVSVKPGELPDLEIVASAAISWAQSIKAAANLLYPEENIRVSLIAAEPGSSRWLAKIEKSKINRIAERGIERWQKFPAIGQLALGLVVAWPITIVPTIDYYSGVMDQAADALGLSDSEVKKAKADADKARADPVVESAQKQIFKTLQRDPKVTGVAAGIPVGPDWRPPTIPANQFAEADGLFSPAETMPHERVHVFEIDVFLVSPQLENKPKTWRFRQEGLPTFPAKMKDKDFLAALEKDAIRENIRTKIPMRIRLEVRQRFLDGVWTDVPRTRSVTKVIEPQTDI